jgi:TonB family protein
MMMRTAVTPLLEHIRELRGNNGERVSRALMVASAIGVVAFVLLLVLKPVQEQLVVKVTMPKERTIVLPDIAPEPPPPAEALPLEQQPLTMQQIETRPAEAEPELPAPRRLDERPKLDPNLGKAGRERARQATADLARSTSAIDKALGDLSASLRTSAGGEPANPRVHSVRSGRSEGELAAYRTGASSGASADLERSTVQAKQVSVGALAASRPPDEAAGGASSDAAGPGVYRSNASLLAVIQRYAAGIQYCYTNELKRNPRAEGKLVVAITVAATGKVIDATIVQNSVGERIAACALTQIVNWRFPPIAEGITSFQTPFVFTPPN